MVCQILAQIEIKGRRKDVGKQSYGGREKWWKDGGKSGDEWMIIIFKYGNH